VAAGIAEGSLVGPLWRRLAITSVIGGLMLLIGLAFAVRMATTIARGEMLHNLLIEELNHRVKYAGDPAGDRGADLSQREQK
jgi:hypothetical protein